MKRIILISVMFLSGCSIFKEVPKVIVKPSASVMADCNDYIYLNEDKEATPKDLLTNISINKKNYDLCVELNKSKKDFIQKLDF